MTTETTKVFGEIPKETKGQNADVIMKSAENLTIPNGAKQTKIRLGVQTKTIAWLNMQPIIFFSGFVEIDGIVYPYTGYEKTTNNKKKAKIMIIK